MTSKDVRLKLTRQYYIELVAVENPLVAAEQWDRHKMWHTEAALDVVGCRCSYECRLVAGKVHKLLRIVRNAGLEVTEKEESENTQ